MHLSSTLLPNTSTLLLTLLLFQLLSSSGDIRSENMRSSQKWAQEANRFTFDNYEVAAASDVSRDSSLTAPRSRSLSTRRVACLCLVSSWLMCRCCGRRRMR